MVEMLIMRGARINVMNRGDDTPLHLAASHGHRDIVQKVGMNAPSHLHYIHVWKSVTSNITHVYSSPSLHASTPISHLSSASSTWPWGPAAAV